VAGLGKRGLGVLGVKLKNKVVMFLIFQLSDGIFLDNASLLRVLVKNHTGY